MYVDVVKKCARIYFRSEVVSGWFTGYYVIHDDLHIESRDLACTLNSFSCVQFERNPWGLKTLIKRTIRWHKKWAGKISAAWIDEQIAAEDSATGQHSINQTSTVATGSIFSKLGTHTTEYVGKSEVKECKRKLMADRVQNSITPKLPTACLKARGKGRTQIE